MSATNVPPLALTVSVEGFPTDVRVAESILLRVTVASTPPRDLRGAAIEVRDAAGVVQGAADVVAFDGVGNRSADLALTAPPGAGVHTWSVVVPEQPLRGALLPEARAEATFTTRARAIHAQAWGLPPAAVAGEPFEAWVGAKGASDVALAGRPFVVRDDAERVVGEGRFADTPHPGTTALHAACVTLPTPPEPGVQRFVLYVPGFDTPIAHEASSHAFTLRTVPAPDARIAVHVIDHATRAPLPRAQVVAHPYRAVTDVEGVAHLDLPRGAYLLFVTCPEYDVYRHPLDVDGDATHTAELVQEIVPDVADQYV